MLVNFGGVNVSLGFHVTISFIATFPSLLLLRAGIIIVKEEQCDIDEQELIKGEEEGTKDNNGDDDEIDEDDDEDKDEDDNVDERIEIAIQQQ